MGSKFDFGGWATKNNLKCGDGRTIRKDAFKDNDGQVVPIVWQHQHNDPGNVLGHGLLENREDGVYVYGTFNSTDAGKQAKALVDSGDITHLSIYANHLKQHGGDVLHGSIREVSLVLAGANPGAVIEYPILTHGDEIFEAEDEAIIYTIDEELSLRHADEEETDKSKEGEKEEMADAKEKTVKDVFDSMTEEQKNVVYFMIGQALEDAGVDSDDEEDDEMKQDDLGGYEMKHNVFDKETDNVTTLSHDDMQQIINDAKRCGSLKEAVLEHMDGGELVHAANADGSPQTYGIADVNYLFPEARTLNTPPEFIKRDTEWVAAVTNGSHHTPFSRIKSMFANITEDEARAKGYIKGNLKKEEVFTLLKRTTSPTTIYKKQKMDRDDVVDITDFDVVAWIKSEMRGMLDEEIARAVLIGDGRLSSDDDKINESNIRPIWKDEDLYTIKATVTVGSSATDDDIAKAMIKQAVKARKNYKGSGNPVLFTTEDNLTNMLLLEDTQGYRLYKSIQELATAMRVSKIITVPVMENLSRVDSNSVTRTLMGIIVNMSDYNIGADKGGAVNMFDDFDIDYNQQKYLIETRCSGALIKPYSAIALEKVVS